MIGFIVNRPDDQREVGSKVDDYMCGSWISVKTSKGNWTEQDERET